MVGGNIRNEEGYEKMVQPGVVADGSDCHGLCRAQPAPARPAAKRNVMPEKRMKNTRVLKLFGIGIVVALACTVVYFVSVVIAARRYTITTILPNTRASNYSLAPSDLTPRQLEILLKVEDPQFFRHGGYDFSTPGAGITTITQGLVKHLYFKKFKPGIAKFRQTLIAAYALDPLMPKDEQLRLFINKVYLGNGAQGFEQASQQYFQKPFHQLSEDEYIAIVAEIIAPEVFNIHNYPARNVERVARIKRLISGEYKPLGLFDLYYGKIEPEAQKQLPAFSYFPSYYK